MEERRDQSHIEQTEAGESKRQACRAEERLRKKGCDRERYRQSHGALRQ